MPYEVREHRRVKRFLRRHPEFAGEMEDIRSALSARPHRGPRVTHLKPPLLCSRRWRTAGYRLLYDILEDNGVVHIFDADVRGDIY